MNTIFKILAIFALMLSASTVYAGGYYDNEYPTRGAESPYAKESILTTFGRELGALGMALFRQKGCEEGGRLVCQEAANRQGYHQQRETGYSVHDIPVDGRNVTIIDSRGYSGGYSGGGHGRYSRWAEKPNLTARRQGKIRGNCNGVPNRYLDSCIQGLERREHVRRTVYEREMREIERRW